MRAGDEAFTRGRQRRRYRLVCRITVKIHGGRGIDELELGTILKEVWAREDVAPACSGVSFRGELVLRIYCARLRVVCHSICTVVFYSTGEINPSVREERSFRSSDSFLIFFHDTRHESVTRRLNREILLLPPILSIYVFRIVLIASVRRR